MSGELDAAVAEASAIVSAAILNLVALKALVREGDDLLLKETISVWADGTITAP